ncbi:MAG: hypothetical protein LW878_12200, partial [Proteobacteria bacterium]|nr:hypothetical protein [Pseudomonadota bacterium]
IELSDVKWPSYTEIPKFFKDNRESMLKYIQLIHQGAGVRLSDRTATGKVTILKGSQNLGTYGFQNGEFYKVLDPGQYTLQVEATVNGQLLKKSVSAEVVRDVVESNGNFVNL